MLNHLSIHNFVIVDKIELEFAPGFTVLTGETGAGKSILIDALALVLGGKGDTGMIRVGCERAEVLAEFDVSALGTVQDWLRESDFVGDPGVCLMRRVIEFSGRSRGFINGRQATLQQLRSLGEQLVDIHGQHAHQSLLRSEAQRELLDGYAGVHDVRGRTAAAYRHWQGLRKRRLEWEKNAEAFAAERERLQWQVSELKGLNFGLDEWHDLLAEHGRLSNAAALMEGSQLGLDLLSEGDMACLPQINSLTARLNGLSEYDPALREILDILEPAEIQLQETVYALRHYLQRLDLDPERLRQCEERLSEVHSAARKYHTTPEQLPPLLADAETRLQALTGEDDNAALQRREEGARADYLALARDLSVARKKASAEIARAVSTAMQDLAMAGGEFQVQLTPLAEGGAFGLEQVEFLVAAHPGLPLRPLAKVASGGELSRLSLAIQVVSSRVSLVPTQVFDEVDVGIGGGVAEIVGKMLKRLGAESQVLCITHLPQVAALGGHHWQVAKTSRDGAVASHISVLGGAARVEEIARMLGGVDITETTRSHAAEMLGLP